LTDIQKQENIGKKILSGFKYEGEDARGAVWSFRVEGEEFIMSYTKIGKARAGEEHETSQDNLILLGTSCYFFDKPEDTIVGKRGEIINVPPNTKHLMIALSDCLIIEHLESPKSKKLFEPYRKVVEASKIA
jgi:quercetin dioxygenase-like cupin family protein